MRTHTLVFDVGILFSSILCSLQVVLYDFLKKVNLALQFHNLIGKTCLHLLVGECCNANFETPKQTFILRICSNTIACHYTIVNTRR